MSLKRPSKNRSDYGSITAAALAVGEDGHADDRRHAVTVPEGTSIMRAAMEAGIDIPKLCATDMLDAFGSCRLCLVEIEAARARRLPARRRSPGMWCTPRPSNLLEALRAG
jgi:ferredoxin